MDPNSRPPAGASCPGTDPAALRLITAAVFAGLVIGGIVVISHTGPAATGPARFSRPGAQAIMARPVMPAATAGRPRPAAPRDEAALRLLQRAAVASHRVPYQGVEILTGWAQAGPATSIVDVWHSPGGVTLTRAVAPVPTLSGEVPHILLPPSPLGSQTLVGAAMLGMSQQLAALLSTNYRLSAAGWGQVAGRRARLISAWRQHGGLAARFWIDTATALPLRRQTYDEQGQVVSNAAFAQVKLGPGAVTGLPATTARAWGDTLATAQLIRMRAQGWPLPGPMPGNLALLDAREDATRSGRVVDLDYSDGLSLVSVFVQRGHLPLRPSGWSRMALRGIPVYTDDADGQSIAWSASGFVYTVVAAAPPQTVGQVVAALPHDASPGFCARLVQGLHRLLSWLSP